MSQIDYNDMFKTNNVKVLDPLINVKSRCPFPVIRGGLETTERSFTTTTFSTNSTQFSAPPPSPNTFVSRRIMLTQPVRVTISAPANAAGGGNAVFQPGKSAFRQFPLASAMETLEVSINGQSSSLNLADIIKPLLLYHNNERNLSDRELSLSPSMRDQTLLYDQLTNPNVSNRNPLGNFGDGNSGAHQPRGAFNYEINVNGGVQTLVVIDTDLTEELFLSPLIFGGGRDEGFIGIQKFDLNITWSSNLADRMWSSINAATLGIIGAYTVSIDFPNPPSLLFRYVTPPMNMQIPPFIQYKYNEIQRYVTNAGPTVVANVGQVSSQVSSNIQLNSIPRFLYLFLRRRLNDATTDFTTTDSYLEIQKCQVNWNNSSSLLSSATQARLYDISRKNGIDMSFSEWTSRSMPLTAAANTTALATAGVNFNGIGSVLCLEFGTDIGLREYEAPGMIGTYNLQVTLDYVNHVGVNPYNVDLYMITSIPGIFTIYSNSASKKIGLLDENDVMMAKELAGIDYESIEKDLMSGGFNFKKIMKRIGKLSYKALPIVKQFVPQKYHGIIDESRMLLAPKGSTGSSMVGASSVGGRRRIRKDGKPYKKPGPKKKALKRRKR